MEQAPTSVDVAKLRAHMIGVDGVLDVHDLHVAAISSHLVTVTAHVTVTHEADGPPATASSMSSANARATTSPSRTPRSSSNAPSTPDTNTWSTKRRLVLVHKQRGGGSFTLPPPPRYTLGAAPDGAAPEYRSGETTSCDSRGSTR